MAKEMGLDRAPIEFRKLVLFSTPYYVRMPNTPNAVFCLHIWASQYDRVGYLLPLTIGPPSQKL